jgi:vancomycin permeability regulator SanA
VGVEANNYYYLKRSRLYWSIREQFATVGAFWDVYLKKPLPVLGDPEPIIWTISSTRSSISGRSANQVSSLSTGE